MTKDEQFNDMERALGVVLAWSTFDNGSMLRPAKVEAICRKALRKEKIAK